MNRLIMLVLATAALASCAVTPRQGPEPADRSNSMLWEEPASPRMPTAKDVSRGLMYSPYGPMWQAP